MTQAELPNGVLRIMGLEWVPSGQGLLCSALGVGRAWGCQGLPDSHQWEGWLNTANPAVCRGMTAFGVVAWVHQWPWFLTQPCIFALRHVTLRASHSDFGLSCVTSSG